MTTPTRAEFTAPSLPSFDSVDEERLHRKQRLAAAFRLFALYGFDEGVAGHIILVNHEGDVVEGNRPVNAAAFTIHSQVHRARPDVVAAAHAHSAAGKAWSSLGRGLDPITQDACAFFEDQSLLDDYTGVVVDLEEGRRIGERLGPNKGIILRNHGLLTVGGSVDEAAWWFISMDRCCQAHLAAEAAGTPVLIDEDAAMSTYNIVGNKYAGWFSFQPLYERIVREQPDLLE